MASTKILWAPNDVMPMEMISASDISMSISRSAWLRAKSSKKKDKNGIKI
jgi:hypothetical protein